MSNINYTMELQSTIKELLHQGTVIPAHPLALNASRTLDEERQRRLTRYYIAAGVGGVAVGVHTTQFLWHVHFQFLQILSRSYSLIFGHQLQAEDKNQRQE